MNSIIWQLAQEALRTGGSPMGMSRWTRRAACGRKALQAEAEREGWDGGIVAFPREASGRLNHLVVGTFYHLLHEHAFAMPADYVWDATESAYTAEMQEAFRLYKAYCRQFGSLADRWGLQDLRFEVPLEAPRGFFEGSW